MDEIQIPSAAAANLLRRASVRPREGQRRTAGGRRWLRAYLNGCAFKVFDSKLSRSLAKIPFAEAAEWLYRTSGFVLMGTPSTTAPNHHELSLEKL